MVGIKLNSELFSPAKNKKILWFRIFGGILCMCGVFTYILLTSMNGNMLNTSYSQGYFIFFICAILLILSLLEMTTDIKSVKPLQWLGINSLCIMLVHEPLKRIIIKAYSIVILLMKGYYPLISYASWFYRGSKASSLLLFVITIPLSFI